MNLPSFKQINTEQGINDFALNYTNCSGFQVNSIYYTSNQVFGVYLNDQMIAGFVLGKGDCLRTLEVFAGTEHRADLYQKLQEVGQSTEMCCFWIAPEYRKRTWLNFYVWSCVAYALQVYGQKQLVFGTNSNRLAALYQHASKSQLLHTDYVNRRQTYIFHGPRKYCLLGVAEILVHKTMRLTKIIGNRQSSGPQMAV